MPVDDADSFMYVDDDDDDEESGYESGHEYPDNFVAEDFRCDSELLPAVMSLFKILGGGIRLCHKGPNYLCHKGRAVRRLLKKDPEAAGVYSRRHRGYPLHLACSMLAPLDVIVPLVRAFPKAVRVCHRIAGDVDMCPLQFSLCHEMVSFDVIRFLVSQWPKALQLPMSAYGNCFALHLACRTHKVSLPIIQYLVQKWPGALKRESEYGLPLHDACRRGANLPTIDFLVQAWPDSLQVPNERGLLPLHEACRFRSAHSEVSAWMEYIRAPALAAATSGRRRSNYLLIAESPPPPPVVILQSLVQAWPAAVRKLDGEGFLPLHHLCSWYDALLVDMQLLVEAWPKALQVATPRRGMLPLHLACQHRFPTDVI